MTPAASADYPRTFSEFIKRFDSEAHTAAREALSVKQEEEQ